MINKGTIFYIGNFSFPDINASGKRVYSNGLLLRDLGYNVVFIGVDHNIKKTSLLKDTKKQYDGFFYYNIHYPQSSRQWISYKDIVKDIQLLMKEYDNSILKMVIFYGSPRIAPFVLSMMRFCHKKGIITITDCVDWLSTRSGNILFDIVKWADTIFQKIYINKKMDGVIAISSYLAEYYKKSKIPVIIIPPLSASNTICLSVSKNNIFKPELIYAGLWPKRNKPIKNPSKMKDRLDRTMIILNKAKQCGLDFIFHVYGLTKVEYLNILPMQKDVIANLGSNLIFHGQTNNRDIMKEISHIDYTILLRDINRMTMAGFPTKVSESIECGIPVITTRTSDIDNYLCEGKQVFFIDLYDDNLASQQLFDVLSVNNNINIERKKACENNNPFFYKNFIISMDSFLNKITDNFNKE